DVSAVPSGGRVDRPISPPAQARAGHDLTMNRRREATDAGMTSPRSGARMRRHMQQRPIDVAAWASA
ncbi:MAG: hypothetical protein ACRDXB_08910, partial [Actinomycetes bacterium]